MSIPYKILLQKTSVRPLTALQSCWTSVDNGLSAWNHCVLAKRHHLRVWLALTAGSAGVSSGVSSGVAKLVLQQLVLQQCCNTSVGRALPAQEIFWRSHCLNSRSRRDQLASEYPGELCVGRSKFPFDVLLPMQLVKVVRLRLSSNGSTANSGYGVQ